MSLLSRPHDGTRLVIDDRRSPRSCIRGERRFLSDETPVFGDSFLTTRLFDFSMTCSNQNSQNSSGDVSVRAEDVISCKPRANIFCVRCYCRSVVYLELYRIYRNQRRLYGVCVGGGKGDR